MNAVLKLQKSPLYCVDQWDFTCFVRLRKALFNNIHGRLVTHTVDDEGAREL